jgi:hypothetical protein
MYDVVDNSSQDIGSLLDIVKEFIPYSQEQMGWRKPVSLFFQSDKENSNKILGKTAYYDPSEFSITVYVDGRHPKDVLRSLSHELVHHDQNCRGDFENSGATEEGYAQKDPHMRNMELEAYERGNIIFRDFEDLIKAGKINVNLTGEPKMSLKEWKNNEVNRLLMEKWGLAEKKFATTNEEQQIFAPNHYCAHHVRENQTGQEGICVDHNWNPKLQEVTKYDVQFSDGNIRTLHLDELTILEAHDASDHPGHAARKEDDWGKSPEAFTGTKGNNKKAMKTLGLEEGETSATGAFFNELNPLKSEEEKDEYAVKRRGEKKAKKEKKISTLGKNRYQKAADTADDIPESLSLKEAGELASRVLAKLQEQDDVEASMRKDPKFKKSPLAHLEKDSTQDAIAKLVASAGVMPGEKKRWEPDYGKHVAQAPPSPEIGATQRDGAEEIDMPAAIVPSQPDPRAVRKKRTRRALQQRNPQLEELANRVLARLTQE